MQKAFDPESGVMGDRDTTKPMAERNAGQKPALARKGRQGSAWLGAARRALTILA
jgi:hypothetical protein